MPITHPDVQTIRSHFPSLHQGPVFLENAGGSQVPRVVIEAMTSYFTERYVQLGAGYDRSRQADAVVHGAHAFVKRFMNAEAVGEVFIGPSTTQLMQMLALAYAARLEPGDEVVIAQIGHEANVGPWARLAERGVTVRFWNIDPATHTSSLEALAALLGPRTRLVAACHVSNLLGGIEDMASVVRMAHDVGARVVVDGVAYAPHRAIDVAALDVDWYVYSAYKVYGPHQAALFGKHDAVAELKHPNHFFIPADDLPYAFEPGGASHEACAGILALASYLAQLADPAAPAIPGNDVEALLEVPRATIEQAFDVMTECELPLQARFVDWLRARDDVQIVGPPSGGPERVSTVAFVPLRARSSDVARAVHGHGIGIRHGHMYAYRMCEALGIDLSEGVVRVSFVHYNTDEEIDRLETALDAALRP